MVVQIGFKLTTRLVTKRSHSQIMRQINQEMMEKIRDLFWPMHFTNCSDTSPGGAYGYAPRTQRYQNEKFKKYGQNTPLVKTGALEAAVRGNATITRTANSATLRSRSPHFLRLRNRYEVEAVSPAEQRELAEWARKRYVELCQSPDYQETMIRNPMAIPD
jgi:hypothetical protein